MSEQRREAGLAVVHSVWISDSAPTFEVTAPRHLALIRTDSLLRVGREGVSRTATDAPETATLAAEVERLRRQLEEITADRRGESNLHVEFLRLAATWRRDTLTLSSSTARNSHPALRSIIAMGKIAVPWILRDLEDNGGHWGPALRELTGAQPVDRADAGRVDRIRAAWLRWGHEHGYL